MLGAHLDTVKEKRGNCNSLTMVRDATVLLVVQFVGARLLGKLIGKMHSRGRVQRKGTQMKQLAELAHSSWQGDRRPRGACRYPHGVLPSSLLSSSPAGSFHGPPFPELPSGHLPGRVTDENFSDSSGSFGFVCSGSRSLSPSTLAAGWMLGAWWLNGVCRCSPLEPP